MIKKILSLVLGLAMVVSAKATTISGVASINGVPLTSGKVTLSLLGCVNPLVNSSTGLPAVLNYTFPLDVRGALPTAAVTGNDVIYCSGVVGTTYYEIKAFNSVGSLQWDRYYRITSSAWSLTTAQVITNFSINQYVFTNPAGDQIMSIPSNSRFSIVGGATLISQLALGQDPVNPTDAVTKSYVDNATANTVSVTNKVNRTGDSLTGPLYLAADPIAPLQAVTKEYADAIQAGAIDPTARTAAAAAAATASAAVPVAGGVAMTGLVTIPTPTASGNPTTKDYVDSADITNATAASAAQTTANNAVPKDGNGKVDLSNQYAASITSGGYVPTLPNDSTLFYNGIGGYSKPAGSGSAAAGTKYTPQLTDGSGNLIASPSTTSLYGFDTVQTWSLNACNMLYNGCSGHKGGYMNSMVLSQVLNDDHPSITDGSAGAGGQQWSGGHMLSQTMTSTANGIYQGIGQQLIHTGLSDSASIYAYLHVVGGGDLGSDEGQTNFGAQILSMGVWKGTIAATPIVQTTGQAAPSASIGTGLQTLVMNNSNSSQAAGEGRYIANTSTPLSTGMLVTKTDVDAAAHGLATITVSDTSGTIDPAFDILPAFAMWSSSTAYTSGTIVYASDGKAYTASQTSTNQNPTTATSYWTLLTQVAYVLPQSTQNTGNLGQVDSVYLNPLDGVAPIVGKGCTTGQYYEGQAITSVGSINAAGYYPATISHRRLFDYGLTTGVSTNSSIFVESGGCSIIVANQGTSVEGEEIGWTIYGRAANNKWYGGYWFNYGRQGAPLLNALYTGTVYSAAATRSASGVVTLVHPNLTAAAILGTAGSNGITILSAVTNANLVQAYTSPTIVASGTGNPNTFTVSGGVASAITAIDTVTFTVNRTSAQAGYNIYPSAEAWTVNPTGTKYAAANNTQMVWSVGPNSITTHAGDVMMETEAPVHSYNQLHTFTSTYGGVPTGRGWYAQYNGYGFAGFITATNGNAAGGYQPFGGGFSPPSFILYSGIWGNILSGPAPSGGATVLNIGCPLLVCSTYVLYSLQSTIGLLSTLSFDPTLRTLTHTGALREIFQHPVQVQSAGSVFSSITMGNAPSNLLDTAHTYPIFYFTQANSNTIINQFGLCNWPSNNNSNTDLCVGSSGQGSNFGVFAPQGGLEVGHLMSVQKVTAGGVYSQVNAPTSTPVSATYSGSAGALTTQYLLSFQLTGGFDSAVAVSYIYAPAGLAPSSSNTYTVTCPTVMEAQGTALSATYGLWAVTTTVGYRKVATCPIGGTVVDAGQVAGTGNTDDNNILSGLATADSYAHNSFHYISGVIGWLNGVGFTKTAMDTGISKVSAGLIAIGNGTQGDFSGSIKLKNIILTSTVAPTVTAGALYYDSPNSRPGACSGSACLDLAYLTDVNSASRTRYGIIGDSQRTLYTSASAVTVANTVTASTILGAGVSIGGATSTTTLPANYLNTVGRSFKATVSGIYSTTAASTTLTITLSIGGQTIVSGVYTSAASAMTNQRFDIPVTVIVQSISGTTATVVVDGAANFSSGSQGRASIDLVTGATPIVITSTNTTLAFDCKATWGAANASNTITATLSRIEEAN